MTGTLSYLVLSDSQGKVQITIYSLFLSQLPWICLSFPGALNNVYPTLEQTAALTQPPPLWRPHPRPSPLSWPLLRQPSLPQKAQQFHAPVSFQSVPPPGWKAFPTQGEGFNSPCSTRSPIFWESFSHTLTLEGAETRSVYTGSPSRFMNCSLPFGMTLNKFINSRVHCLTYNMLTLICYHCEVATVKKILMDNACIHHFIKNQISDIIPGEYVSFNPGGRFCSWFLVPASRMLCIFIQICGSTKSLGFYAQGINNNNKTFTVMFRSFEENT